MKALQDLTSEMAVEIHQQKALNTISRAKNREMLTNSNTIANKYKYEFYVRNSRENSASKRSK